MLKRSMLTLCCSLLFTVNCLAQAIDPAQQLRDFGNKMVEGTWHQKLPEDVTARAVYRWALGNQFLILHLWNEEKPNALAVVGVDPVTNLQTWWIFQDDGAVEISTVDVKAHEATRDRIELTLKGSNESQLNEVVWGDADSLDVISIPGLNGDSKGELKERWIRSKEVEDLSWIDAEESKSLAERLPILRQLTGRKWIDGVTPEKSKFVGGSYGKWILDGKFHVFTGSTAQEDQVAWGHLLITGMDPETKAPAAWEFSSLGATSYITYDKSGTTIYGKHIHSNGDEYSFEGHFTTDGDLLRYKSEIGKKGEDRLPYGWNYRDAE